MNLRSTLAALVFLVLFSSGSAAQEKEKPGYSPSSVYTLSYSISVPVGSYKDFTQDVSFTGGVFTGRYFLVKGLCLGFEFGWNNYFSQPSRTTFYLDDGMALTGTYYSYSFIIPWKAGIYYYFLNGVIASPFLGLGVGGDYMEEHILMQEYDIYKAQWGFTLSPELGVLIKFSKNSHWAASLSGQYWFNTNSFSIESGKTYSLIQGINFNAGISYLIR